MTDIDHTAWVVGHRRIARSLHLLAILPIAVLTSFLSQVPIYAAASEQSPTEAIQGTVTELFSILNEVANPHRSEARRREIE